MDVAEGVHIPHQQGPARGWAGPFHKQKVCQCDFGLCPLAGGGRGKNVSTLSRPLQRMLEGRIPCQGMGGATVHFVIRCCSSKCMLVKYTASMRLAKMPRNWVRWVPGRRWVRMTL